METRDIHRNIGVSMSECRYEKIIDVSLTQSFRIQGKLNFEPLISLVKIIL